MTVRQACRCALDPTARQRQAAGTARCAFNRRLVLCKRRLNVGRTVPQAVEGRRRWNAEKPQRSWVYGVSFWRARQAGRSGGFPRLRRKPGRRNACRLTGSPRVHPRSVSLPRIGGVRTRETTQKFDGRMTVGREAGRDDPQPVEGPTVGVDLGRACLAVFSPGARSASPEPLAQAMRRRRGSGGTAARRDARHRRKSATGLARWHRRSRCPRTDLLRQATTDLAEKPGGHRGRRPVCARHAPPPASCAVRRGRRVAFRRMLAHRSEWYGSRLVVAPGFHPSTQTCSACHQTRAERSLGERPRRGEGCGAEIDQDLKAARSLAARVGGRSPETQNAPGAADAGQENGLVPPTAAQQASPSRKPTAPAPGQKAMRRGTV